MVNRNSRVAGTISQRHGVVWVVNLHRKDRRTGAQQPVRSGRYVKKLLKSVSMGNVNWGCAANPDDHLGDEAAEFPTLPSYCLNYMVGKERGRNGLIRSEYHYFTAADDLEAWQIANRHILLHGVSAGRMKEALLYQDDREVQRSMVKKMERHG